MASMGLTNLPDLNMSFNFCHSLVDVSSIGNDLKDLTSLKNHHGLQLLQSLADVSSVGNGLNGLACLQNLT
jgi:hypothetical protein